MTVKAPVIITFCCCTLVTCLGPADEPTPEGRIYFNTLTPISRPAPLLADHPEFFEPIIERRHYEAPAIVDDVNADLHVRAWRFSYNARGIIEMPNHLRASETAVIMVHPWGIDDAQGWRTPQPSGVADFCTVEKNHLAARHTREIIGPFLKSLRSRVRFVMYSLPGAKDEIRTKLYRSLTHTPSDENRRQGAVELDEKLNSFDYAGQELSPHLSLSARVPVIDYFQQFPGLDAGAKYNNVGFWDLPIPVTSDLEVDPGDIVIYDQEGYAPLRTFLTEHGVRHVLLTGYATDMCFCETTAGYNNLSRDFNVFLVGDASLATFPANSSPRFAVNASISFASLSHLITQVSWVKLDPVEN